MSEPLKDKRLEAVAQILAADCGDPTATIESARLLVSRGGGSPLYMFKAAIRETLAGELAAELTSLYRGYVLMLEVARDRIISLGGECDSVDSMEQGDPRLFSARALLARFKDLNHE